MPRYYPADPLLRFIRQTVEYTSQEDRAHHRADCSINHFHDSIFARIHWIQRMRHNTELARPDAMALKESGAGRKK